MTLVTRPGLVKEQMGVRPRCVRQTPTVPPWVSEGWAYDISSDEAGAVGGERDVANGFAMEDLVFAAEAVVFVPEHDFAVLPADGEGGEDRVPAEDAGWLLFMDFEVEHGRAVLLEEDDLGLGERDGEDRLELGVAPGCGEHLVVGVEGVGVVESHSNFKYPGLEN